MKKKNIVISCIAVIAIVGIFFMFYWVKRVKLYDDDSITGNTSGNLLNGGLFCELDDKIYFANPYDQNMLYSMNSDLTNVSKLSDDNVSYLNAAGNYLFYTKRNDKKDIDSDSFMALKSTGLYRTNLKGKNIARLYDDPTQVACLFGNNIYYQHYDQTEGLQLYAAKIDGSSDTQLLKDACAPYAISNQTIYFIGYRTNPSIHTMRIDGSADTILLNGNFTALTIQGDYLYYMDMDDNYSLKRISVSGGEPEALVSERLATYNVSEDGNTVYCQVDNGTDNGIYELDLNSKSLNLVVSGDFNYLHLTSNYLFYESFDQSALYILDLATNQPEEWKWEK